MAVFPTQRRTLALLTAGSASEVTNKSSFVLSWAMTYKADGTPKNNSSGYSVGTLQSDVGQRPHLVGELVHSYYQWAGTDATRLVERTEAQMIAAMQKQGNGKLGEIAQRGLLQEPGAAVCGAGV